MKILFSYLKNYRPLIILALGLATVNQCFSLLDPIIFQHLWDKYVTHINDYTQKEFLVGTGKYLLLGMGAAMVSRIAKNFQDYFMNVIVQKMGAKIYQDGLKHSLSLPYQVFEDQRSGQTLSVLQKARTDIEKLMGAFINVVFISLVGFIFVTIFAFTVSWKVAVVYIAAVPIIGFLSSILSKNIKRVQKSILGETTSLAGSTTESLRNIELVKSLGLARQEEKRLNGITDKILSLELKKVRYVRSLSFIQGTTINLLRTGIVYLMLFLIFGHSITTGQYWALMIFSFFIFGPLQELGSVIQIYREAEASLKNFSDIMSREPEPRPAHPIPITSVSKLEFDHVSFQHQTATTKALNDISFDLKTGETIAFVGPSGSGKTTLVKLLVGLYRPAQGQILYNGLRHDQIDLDGLREKIGFVTQDTQLFSGTIRENLLFVNPDATEAQCFDVLHKAACQNLLARADKGLDTLIGEGGVKVSGGERQRLSIARALLRNPDLLVFDEATSALDSITEEEISKTIRDVSTNQSRLTIMIAHRLSTVMHADRIFVLEQGNIIEHGRHENLLADKGLYYAMWRQQIGEKKIETPQLKVVG
ncbi:MAG: ABC transporter ATP-binding protein [Bacteroidetes bacterium]|nr:ABC transporter ATP-binding protein [Bacteroidota bacterium]